MIIRNNWSARLIAWLIILNRSARIRNLQHGHYMDEGPPVVLTAERFLASGYDSRNAAMEAFVA